MHPGRFLGGEQDNGFGHDMIKQQTLLHWLLNDEMHQPIGFSFPDPLVFQQPGKRFGHIPKDAH